MLANMLMELTKYLFSFDFSTKIMQQYRGTSSFSGKFFKTPDYEVIGFVFDWDVEDYYFITGRCQDITPIKQALSL
jgi:hypothetical protein